MLCGCLLEGQVWGQQILQGHSAYYDTGNYHSCNVEWDGGVDVQFQISFVVVA